MIRVRRNENRGQANHGWLRSKHTFSFADYHDPAWMGFRSLRVINEDKVAPSKGFATHQHENMEILSYVIRGQLAHKDSMGNASIIEPGEVQLMSAGTGVSHSEYNPSDQDWTHFLQIWLLPSEKETTPSYQQTLFPLEVKNNKLCLIASPTGVDGSLTIKQDACIYLSVLEKTKRVSLEIKPNRHAFVQVISGSLHVNFCVLEAGDGALIWEEDKIDIFSAETAEFLLFDLA